MLCVHLNTKNKNFDNQNIVVTTNIFTFGLESDFIIDYAVPCLERYVPHKWSNMKVFVDRLVTAVVHINLKSFKTNK